MLEEKHLKEKANLVSSHEASCIADAADLSSEELILPEEAFAFLLKLFELLLLSQKVLASPVRSCLSLGIRQTGIEHLTDQFVDSASKNGLKVSDVAFE